RGVYPDGWEEQVPGTWLSDDAALLQAAGPVRPDDLIENLADQFELDSDEIELTGEYEGTINGFEWELYTAEGAGFVIDIAVARERCTTFAVIMLSEPLARDELYNAVFLPCVDALEALD